MVIDLELLQEGETEWSTAVNPEEIDLSHPDFTFDEKIHAQLVVMHVEQQYIIRGWVTTQARSECVRCLASFTVPVEEHIAWAVQELPEQMEDSEGDDSEDFWHIPAGTSELEIGDRVRETILVALPTNPRCTPDCRGLCPQCGTNLNEGDCDCRQESIDPRWAALQELARKSKNDDTTSS